MKAIFLQAARLEERQAALHYREERPELALRFRVELKMVIQRIVQSPRQFPRVTSTHRKALLPVFPYAVFFEVTESEILIVAISHLKREPFYWLDRTN
jgi:plasmid stabilization system protein ParE